MAQSPLEICNAALSKVGANRITSLTEDSKEARLCNSLYDPLRKVVEASHPWKFCTNRMQLALMVDTPIFGYARMFEIPLSVLRVLEVNCDNYPFSNETYNGKNVIATDASTCFIVGIIDNPNTTMWTPTFDDALSWRLAADLAYPLTQDETVTQNMFQMFERAVSYARSYDAQSGGRGQVRANGFLNVRR